jgi:hypothetical protein
MNGEEPGLLGNLPKSRPGTRSEKRDGGATEKPPPAPPEPADRNPATAVGDALWTVARTAGGVSREILRRLPRP